MNNKNIKNTVCLFFTICLLLISVCADNALDITDNVTINSSTLNIPKITDNNLSTHSAGSGVTVEILSDIPLEGIYIKFNKIPSKGLLDGKTEVSANGFLHEYISLDGKTGAVLTYDNTDICDLQVFSKGTLPEDVQIWKTGNTDTDILLCATHSDDDQLFFAGLLPYYAKHVKANVRVAYFINHFDTYNRTHELLDGLWHCGITNYPDISPFPDLYSESAEEAQRYLENKGYDYNDLLNFQKRLLQKYKPLVVVLHDFNGEYGHGAHMLNTKTFVEAYEHTLVNEYVPEKVYVHLYNENEIVLPIDEVLSSLGNKSPFQISQEAFEFHKSQHWTWFYGWIYGKNTKITKASQITRYVPQNYGLYYSRVGEDAFKNDMLENVVTYNERRIIAEKKAEKQALFEKELLEKEKLLEKERTEEENKKKELLKAAENESLTSNTVTVLLFACILSALIITAIIILKNKKKR